MVSIKDKNFTSSAISGRIQSSGAEYINCWFTTVIEDHGNDCSFFNFKNCSFIGCKFNTFIDGMLFKDCKFENCRLSGANYDDFNSYTFIGCRFENKMSYLDNPDGLKIVLSFYMCALDYLDIGSCKDVSDFVVDLASLSNSSLNTGDDVMEKLIPLKCPKEGSFIGWKKIDLGLGKTGLCKLEIPEDALRSSGLSNKCRCSEAKVLSIERIDHNYDYDYVSSDSQISEYHYYYKSGYSFYDLCFEYKVGKTVKCIENFDNNRFHECSSGIHFFMSKQDAIDY